MAEEKIKNTEEVKDGTANDNCTCEAGCCCKENESALEDFKKVIEELTVETQNAKNESLLAKAEMVNYRKRKDEEVAKMLKYANEDLVKELLPIIDNFERAIKLDTANLNEDLSKFLEGFKMMYCNQVSILEKYGVKAIDGNNKLFDPNYHQAVITEHADGVEPGMVLEVLQKGYLLKDKVIRHAMVKVSE